MSRDNTKASESILDEDLAKNVSLSLHNSFCLNMEYGVQGEGFAKPGEEIARAEGMDAILRTTKGLGRDRDQLRRRGRVVEAGYSVECITAQHLKGEEHEMCRMLSVGFLSLEREREKGLSANSDET